VTGRLLSVRGISGAGLRQHQARPVLEGSKGSCRITWARCCGTTPRRGGTSARSSFTCRGCRITWQRHAIISRRYGISWHRCAISRQRYSITRQALRDYCRRSGVPDSRRGRTSGRYGITAGPCWFSRSRYCISRDRYRITRNRCRISHDRSLRRGRRSRVSRDPYPICGAGRAGTGARYRISQ
jgi:hypothetical protein